MAEGEKFNGLLHNGDSDRGISGELGELSEGDGGDESRWRRIRVACRV